MIVYRVHTYFQVPDTGETFSQGQRVSAEIAESPLRAAAFEAHATRVDEPDFDSEHAAEASPAADSSTSPDAQRAEQSPAGGDASGPADKSKPPDQPTPSAK